MELCSSFQKQLLSSFSLCSAANFSKLLLNFALWFECITVYLQDSRLLFLRPKFAISSFDQLLLMSLISQFLLQESHASPISKNSPVL